MLDRKTRSMFSRSDCRTTFLFNNSVQSIDGHSLWSRLFVVVNRRTRPMKSLKKSRYPSIETNLSSQIYSSSIIVNNQAMKIRSAIKIKKLKNIFSSICICWLALSMVFTNQRMDRRWFHCGWMTTSDIRFIEPSNTVGSLNKCPIRFETLQTLEYFLRWWNIFLTVEY